MKYKSRESCTSTMNISPYSSFTIISTRLNLSAMVCWLLSLSRHSVMVILRPSKTVKKPSKMPKLALSRSMRFIAQSNRMRSESFIVLAKIVLFSHRCFISCADFSYSRTDDTGNTVFMEHR